MAKAKILIVEDEAITAKDLQNMLRGLGYDAPAIAASGEGAIKKAEAIKPDLILMDIILKGDMDGIEAAEQIRDRFDIPVVYVSAYIDEERLKKTKVTEPYGYIIKPFGDKDLRPVIEMALQRHKLEKALRIAEADWRNSFNSLDDVMLIVDRDYNIENINEIGLKLLGKSKEEVIGQKCYQIISGADSPGEECPCRKSLETKKVESIDRYEERFGKYYSIRTSPIFDENGEIVKFVDLRRDITERKQAEEKYRLLAESAQDHIFIIDSDMRIQYTNQFAAGLLGYRPEEIIGKHLEEVFPLDLSNSLKHNLQTVFESGELLHVEDRFTLPDKELWLDTRLIPLKTESGEIKSILGISRDITDRKRAEEEIRKLSSAVEQSIDGIAIGDLEPKLTYVNDAFARMHGYSSDEMIGMKVVNLHNEEQMDEYKSGMNQIKTQGGWVGEIGHIRKDGTPFPTYMSVTLLKGADGKPTGILAAARDITERKQAEDALRESQGRFRALTESTSDWIWEVDENAVYTYTSPMIKELLGYEPEEIIGKIPFDLMTPEGVKRVAAEFGAIAEAQKPFERLENENLHKDGQILVLETSGVPIFDANGNFRGYRGIDRDITERKRAEEELEEKNEALKRFNKLAVGRELRMIELKKEINALLEDQDKEPRYKIAGES